MRRIEFIKGSSTDPKVLERIARQVSSGSRVLVLLDSLHTKEHVLRELRSYSPFVSKGSYLIVNDTHIDHTNVVDYGPGPMAAIREFVKTSRAFVVDRSKDRFLITCARSGFLKRTR
jgi:cephalosporin hydroxylase